MYITLQNISKWAEVGERLKPALLATLLREPYVQATAAAWLLSSSAPHFAGKEKILIRYAWNIWLLPCRGQPGDKSKNYYGGCLLPPHLHEQARWWAPGSSTQLGGLTQQTSVEIMKPARKRWDHICVCANNLSRVTPIQANVSSQWLELFRAQFSSSPPPLVGPRPRP